MRGQICQVPSLCIISVIGKALAPWEIMCAIQGKTRRRFKRRRVFAAAPDPVDLSLSERRASQRTSYYLEDESRDRCRLRSLKSPGFCEKLTRAEYMVIGASHPQFSIRLSAKILPISRSYFGSEATAERFQMLKKYFFLPSVSNCVAMECVKERDVPVYVCTDSASSVRLAMLRLPRPLLSMVKSGVKYRAS